MVQTYLEAGQTIAGFHLEARVHKGGMASLWRVTRPGETAPMLLKAPFIGEGADPAAIVSFEMEQAILPRLTGPHVPRFVAAGSFDTQPHLVMEEIPGTSLYPRLPDLPLPYDEVARIGHAIALALDDVHRQHVVHHDIKPSNIMFRPTGEAVLLDFGLAFHEQLPDLLQEEFRVPYGTAPYMAPERLTNVRNDPRSDFFSLGVLLYFFATGVRPFGEGERLSSMRQRLWRDPHPPRRLRPDLPPWLQEIILRCLEIDPAWRYGSAALLAFDLAHPDEVKLTARSEKLRRDPLSAVIRRRFNPERTTPTEAAPVTAQLDSAPLVLVAIDLSGSSPTIDAELQIAARRLLATLPGARLACLSVLKLARIAIDTTLDDEGRNKHVELLARLRHWSAPLAATAGGQVSYHVIEAIDPARAILDFAAANKVAHVLLGARQSSLRKSLLGSVSAEVAAHAGCSVTIVRPRDYGEEK